jgi:hypothetical protein
MDFKVRFLQVAISEDFDRLCPADGLYCDSHKSIRFRANGKDSGMIFVLMHSMSSPFPHHERLLFFVIRNWFFLRVNYMQPEELASLYLDS